MHPSRIARKNAWLRGGYALGALCSIVIASLPVGAADPSLRPGIIGKDDRVRVEQEGGPWDAIGHVNIGGYRRTGACTGTLVAPDLVITAAHCVIDKWKGAPYPLHNIHFLAGVRGGENKGHATAKCLHFKKGYEHALSEGTRPSQGSTEALSTDVVAIVLRDQLAIAPLPLAQHVVPKARQRLVHASYPADRRFALSAHFGCRLSRSAAQGRLWLTDCDTHPGSSGGPLLVEADGSLRLAAIMVAAGAGAHNVALPIDAWMALTQDRACP